LTSFKLIYKLFESQKKGRLCLAIYNSKLAITMSNKAAWIPKSKGQLEVSEAPMPKAGKDEVVIKNGAVAVNPVDCKTQS
jgi:hypothetical protein